MNILSFGEIVWDIYEDTRVLGGAPLNFAAHSALQGNAAWLLSAVGNDELGADAQKQIAEYGIRSDYITVIPNAETGKCIVSFETADKPTYRVAEESAFDRIEPPQAFEGEHNVLVFGTVALRKAHNRETLRCMMRTIPFDEIFVDLNIRPPFYSEESVRFCMSSATIVKISDEELPVVTELLFRKQMDPEKAAVLLGKTYPQLKLVLITLGEQGSFCYDCRSGAFHRCPIEPVPVVSAVGAGDSFGATFLTQYAKTGNIDRALSLASKVSAFVVSGKGAVPDGIEARLKCIFLNKD